MSSPLQTGISRRSVVKGVLGAGIGMALGAAAAPAAQALPLITKPIPSTGEKLPVVGLGTNAYGVSEPQEIAARREVLRAFPQLGAKVVDTARGYGDSELVLGKLIAELGIREQLFLATKTPVRGDVKDGAAELEEALRRLQTKRLDLLQIHNFHEAERLVPLLRRWKEAGKVRYIGVTTSTDEQYPELKAAMRTLPLDFIQVDYSIDNRGAEQEILPLALDKGLAVLVNVPLGGRRGNLLPRVAGRALPDFGIEFDAVSWAQILLKYVISHPAVTAVIPGTTKLKHLEDNQGAARGRLPDAPMRRMIEEYWATVI